MTPIILSPIAIPPARRSFKQRLVNKLPKFSKHPRLINTKIVVHTGLFNRFIANCSLLIANCSLLIVHC